MVALRFLLPWLILAQSPVSLDVVSVRQAEWSSSALGMPQLLPGRLVIRNGRIETLARGAYRLPTLPGDMLSLVLIGVPDAMRSVQFNVEATLRPASARLSWAEWGPFLLEILETRFAWQAHTERRDLPVYALQLATPGRLGPSLRPRDEPCDATRSNCRSTTEVLPGGGLHEVNHGPIERIKLAAQGWRMDRIVVDQTGLTGDFDWELTYEIAPDASVDQQYPTRIDALEDQLGLVLVPTEVPMDVVVVDAVSMPEPN